MKNIHRLEMCIANMDTRGIPGDSAHMGPIGSQSLLQYSSASLSHIQLGSTCAYPWRYSELLVDLDTASQLWWGTIPEPQRSRCSLMAAQECQPVESGRFLLFWRRPGDCRNLHHTHENMWVIIPFYFDWEHPFDYKGKTCQALLWNLIRVKYDLR